LPVLLRRAWYGLNQAFRRRIAHTGFTPDQYTVLRTILENQARDLTQRELTRLMASDPNTVAALLDRMEHAGLVTREPHAEDRRAHRLSLQPQGRAAYRLLRRKARELQAEMLDALPEEQRERFLALLDLVANRCQALAQQAAESESARPPARRLERTV
jgi:DNA-binding MarR family transcriptional regulator